MEKREITFREIWEAGSAQREILKKQINYGDPFNRYIPNRVYFQKSKEEKALLATLKLQNKEDRKRVYGKDYKKYLNIPEKSLNLKS